MRVVPLAATPNQSFTVTLDNVRWAIRLATAAGVTVCDIARDGVELLRGVRALAGQPLIPYKRLETGNFIFVVDGDELPAYAQFGVTQTLVYLSPAEIAAVMASTVTYDDIVPFQPSALLTDDGFYLTTDAGEFLTDD